jgi:hypothetical protein
LRALRGLLVDCVDGEIFAYQMFSPKFRAKAPRRGQSHSPARG